MRSLDSLWRYAHAGHPVSPRDYRGLTASAFSLPWRSAEDIPLEARIVAIADVFDALTSERPYKKAWPVEKAIAVIQEDAGSHFDPNLVPIFIEKLPQVLEVKAEYTDNFNGNED